MPRALGCGVQLKAALQWASAVASAKGAHKQKQSEECNLFIELDGFKIVVFLTFL